MTVTDKNDLKFFHPNYQEEGLTPGISDMFSGGAIQIANPDTPAEVRAQIREGVEQIIASGPQPTEEMLSQVEIKEITIKALKEGDPDIGLLIISPKNAKEPLSCIFDIHGGGWVMGTNKWGFTGNIANVIKFNSVLVSANYYLAPEFKHEKIIDSLEASINWVVSNAEDLNVDTSRIAIRGGSAGGHLALAISHRLKLRDNGFQFCAQVVNNPMPDDRSIYQSNYESTDNCWSVEAAVAVWKAFLGDDYGTPYVPEDAAPGRATNFKGLPPTFLHIAELDHDRDTCIEYAKNLMQAGTFVDFHVHGGQYHASFFYQSSSSRTRELIQHHMEEALTGKYVR